VAGSPGILRNGGPIPLKAQPLQTIKNGSNRLFCGALAVSVLDAQQHLAVLVLGEGPVEERGARSPDMQETCGRGGKAGDDGR
jgi:hypothetical protein